MEKTKPQYPNGTAIIYKPRDQTQDFESPDVHFMHLLGILETRKFNKFIKGKYVLCSLYINKKSSILLSEPMIRIHCKKCGSRSASFQEELFLNKWP